MNALLNHELVEKYPFIGSVLSYCFELIPESARTLEGFFIQLVSAVVICFLLNIILNKSQVPFIYVQKKLYKSNVNRLIKLRLTGVFRFLISNSPWLFSLLIFTAYSNSTITMNLFDYIFTNFLLFYAFFRFLLLAAKLVIEHTYNTTNEFASKSTLKSIHKSAKRFSYLSIIFISPLLLLNLDDNGLLSFFITALVFLMMLRQFVVLIADHEIAISKFIKKQLPSNNEVAKKDFIPSLFIVYFFLAYCLKLIMSIHQVMLKIPFYQGMTAKILWLHLDQKQQDIVEEDELVDENYENWFKASFEPKQQQIIKTENITNNHEQLNKIIKSWSDGKRSENNLLLHGNRGIGKTLLIQEWAKTADEETSDRILFANLNRRDTSTATLLNVISTVLDVRLDSIEDLLSFDDAMEKTIVVLDNCENLFLNSIGGFEPYKQILAMINLPLKNIFWMFTIGTETHKVLNSIFGKTNQFSHCLNLVPWKSEEIRKLIMTRHDASKRKLVFDDLLFASMGNDEYSTYSATADRFFLLLAEQCSGNPALAISLWFKASSKKLNYTIEIGLPEKPSTGFLSDCSEDLLFIYASLIKHKHLNQKDASKATRQDESVASRAFKYGMDQGFLELNHHGDFSIKSYWHYQIVQFLNNKNYLAGI